MCSVELVSTCIIKILKQFFTPILHGFNFSSSVAIILHVICCGFFALFSVGMRYAGQVIFVFVAKQTANDDCAKVQLVTKENIFSVC